MAAAVVEALKARLAPQQQASSYRTSNPEAYNQFLLGRQFVDRSNFDDYQRAAVAYRKAIALDPGYATALIRSATVGTPLLEIGPEKSLVLLTVGVLAFLQGEAERALAIFRRCRDEEQRQLITSQATCCAYQVAEVYAWRGEKDMAFEWLNRAYRQLDGGLSEIKADPLLSSLHDDSRYDALLRKLRLQSGPALAL